jgi:hypothetical protein
MAIAYSVPQVLEHSKISEIPKKLPQAIPVKVAWFGEQGTGKTTSAALLAAALSKEIHSGAEVWVTDPEASWQFADRRIFKPEGIKLVQRTVPTFKAMMQDLRDAERAGACVWAVELTKIWSELLKTVQKQCGDRWGMELVNLWTEYVNAFLNSKLTCMGLGRITDITEDLMNDQDQVKRVKTGETMKAGGQKNNFGFEPHLVIRMRLEQKPRRKNGREVPLEDDSRMIHVADIRKDRTWALNNRLFRWPDKNAYQVGGYKRVWESLKPHWTEVQATMGFVTLDTQASSDSLVNDNGNSEWAEMRERRGILSAEISKCMELMFGGRGQEEIKVRIGVNDVLFGVKSKEAAEKLPLKTLERGLRILHAYESSPARDMTNAETVFSQIGDCIREYDRGESEQWDMPF